MRSLRRDYQNPEAQLDYFKGRRFRHLRKRSPAFQNVCVTICSDRGRSGLIPFTSANCAAKSCPGIM